ncbi:HEAT repeat domain-containing protein [Algiphilus sp. W345]|uniref:HEAT repeat domain-containing protein n=1 Tax=Banduia mediterranea TaxID=3075609 RepID=A0ABU2WG51_9GAMM|nr:HEAT repeat domain-containing protein [Algiphilus sp. W345]MDT0496077.1 HEAT repeat domain-containing protein [Algiphilus sp. W345]
MTKGEHALAALVESAESVFRPEAPESFWDCRAAFQAFVDSSFLRDEINRQLIQQRARPDFVGSWFSREWVLHRERFLLSVSLHEEPQRYIHALPTLAFYALLSGESVDYDVYRLPDSYRNDVFDPSLHLEPVESRRLRCGEVLSIESDRFVYDFRFRQPTLLLKLVTPPIRTLEWLFSRDRLQAWQANDADLSFTQLRVAATVLGRFAHHSSIDPVEKLTKHPHHAVRWAAIQNLARLYRLAAIQALEAATHDRHPHVQSAARKALQAITDKKI